MRVPLLLAALLLIAGCPRQEPGREEAAATAPSVAESQEQPLIVWADPLLEASLTALAERFAAQYAPGLKALYLERDGILVRMTSEWSPPGPDVFLLTDAEAFAALRQHGSIDEATARTFAGDRLVLVQREGRGFTTTTLFDAYRLRFEAMGIGGPETAAGYYTSHALVAAGCLNRLEDRLRRFQDTREVLDALASEEVDLAITTASALAGRTGLEVVLLIDPQLYDPIRYKAVAAAGVGGDDAVQAFLRLIAEDEDAQALLVGYGFLDRETAMQANP